MSDSKSSTERNILFLLRVSVAWVFLYAASRQAFNPDFAIVGLLNNTKTFHWLFQIFAGPVIVDVTTFLVAYGHLAIGLGLLFGVFTRAAAVFGIALNIIYWMAHMDFPYIYGPTWFLVDFHVHFVLILWLVIHTKAGHILGLDSAVAEFGFVKNNRLLSWAAN